MSVVINTNYSATVASNNLAASNGSLQKSLNRLSSGSKIVSPADDAGGLAVSMKLSAAAKRQAAVSTNIGNATSYLQTQDGALKIAGKVLDRISELKTLYNDPTKNASDLANYNSEFTALQAQLTSLASEQSNGVALFGTTDMTVKVTEDGSTSSAVTAKAVSLLGTSTSATTLLSDNFANFNNWNVTNYSGSATISSGVATLTGTNVTGAEIATNASFAGPYQVNMQVQFAATGGRLRINSENGSDFDLVQGAAGLGANTWHDVKIDVDAAGNACPAQIRNRHGAD